MTNPDDRRSRLERRQRRMSRLAVSAGLAALAFAAWLATMAMASSPSPTTTIGSALDSKLGEQVLVNSQGRTLYALSPETTSRLLCKSSACLSFWPPVTVTSRNTKLKDGAGVHGAFGIFRRGDGVLQVTYRGLLLYRYTGDHAKGEANGQGLKSFGGTWHVLDVSPAGAPASSSPVEPGPSSPGYSGGEGAAAGTTSSSTATTTPGSPTPAATPTTPTSTTPTKPSEEKYEQPKGETGW
jgi:predicted lipoprotein with Yx(FWY)xxD motif